MRIDCDTCPAPRGHCAECAVSAVPGMRARWIDGPPGSAAGHDEPLDHEERRAVDLFAGVGLIAAREAVSARAWCEAVVEPGDRGRARFVG